MKGNAFMTVNDVFKILTSISDIKRDSGEKVPKYKAIEFFLTVYFSCYVCKQPLSDVSDKIRKNFLWLKDVDPKECIRIYNQMKNKHMKENTLRNYYGKSHFFSDNLIYFTSEQYRKVFMKFLYNHVFTDQDDNAFFLYELFFICDIKNIEQDLIKTHLNKFNNTEESKVAELTVSILSLLETNTNLKNIKDEVNNYIKETLIIDIESPLNDDGRIKVFETRFKKKMLLSEVNPYIRHDIFNRLNEIIDMCTRFKFDTSDYNRYVKLLNNAHENHDIDKFNKIYPEYEKQKEKVEQCFQLLLKKIGGLYTIFGHIQEVEELVNLRFSHGELAGNETDTFINKATDFAEMIMKL